MDIYLTIIETGELLQFPMVPEEIKVVAETRMQTYEIMNTGEHKIPLGENLTVFSWSDKFPGEARKNEPYVKAWQPPMEIQKLLSRIKHGGKKCRLMITDTPINHDVYLTNYQILYKGGHGDYHYDIEFVNALNLVVHTETELKLAVNNPNNTNTRPAKPQGKTYKVKSGDTLWKIAQKHLGSGAKYPQIAKLNGISNPNKIKAGQVLKLP